jgi:hypothetical protein
MKQLDPELCELIARPRVGETRKLDEKKALLGRRVGGLCGSFARGLDCLIPQLNGLGGSAERSQAERNYSNRVQPPSGLHIYILLGLDALSKSERRK